MRNNVQKRTLSASLSDDCSQPNENIVIFCCCSFFFWISLNRIIESIGRVVPYTENVFDLFKWNCKFIRNTESENCEFGYNFEQKTRLRIMEIMFTWMLMFFHEKRKKNTIHFLCFGSGMCMQFVCFHFHVYTVNNSKIRMRAWPTKHSRSVFLDVRKTRRIHYQQMAKPIL